MPVLTIKSKREYVLDVDRIVKLKVSINEEMDEVLITVAETGRQLLISQDGFDDMMHLLRHIQIEKESEK